MSDDNQYHPHGPITEYVPGKFYFKITVPRQNDGFEESWTYVSDVPLTREGALTAFLARQGYALIRILSCEPPVSVCVWRAYPLQTVVGWFTLHGSINAHLGRIDVGAEVDTARSPRRKKHP